MLKKSVFTMVFIILALSLGKSYGDVNNVLTNPGFESQTTGWSAFGGSFTTVTSSPSPHSGSRSGRAYSRTATWNGILQSVLNKMTVGQTYNVSGWVRTASPSATIMLTFAKTDGGTTYYAQGATGAANNTSWTYISGSYTLTANGTITTLNFYVESSDLNDIYLDDANIIQQTPPPSDANATADVNFGAVFQRIEGFGAAGVYDPPNLTSNSQSETLYDLMFRDLGLDILRIRNTYSTDSGGYGGDNGSNMTATKTMVAAAKLRNPALKTELVPWSPQASLKSTGSVNAGTLANSGGAYVYSAYGTWWADSLDAFAAEPNMLIPDYISIQNEPDWEPNYDGCKFLATESSSYAGYDQAFKAVYDAIYARQGSNMPKMIAPETMGFGNSEAYINALNNLGQINRIYGFSHHLYSDGDYTNPDGMISGMESYASTYGNYYNKPLIMTEYVQNGVTPNFDMALLMAWHIHNTLVHEGATSFYWWTLFRYSGNSTGGMINFSSSSYTIRDIYWFFKHYAFFTNPGWYRVGTTTASSDLRITAFRDVTDSNMAIVILNKSTATDVNLTLSLDGFTPPENWLTNEIYRSSSTEHWAYLGTFDPCQSLMIPAQSITTIHIATFQTCADVQNNSHGLYEDLNGDCYVDFYDLQIIADNWLRNDCNGLNDWCNWADWPSMNGSVDFIDLSNFAPEWMQCNNPLDPNCTHNW